MAQGRAVRLVVVEILERIAVVAAQPVPCPEPQETVLVLGYGVDRVVRQAVRVAELPEPDVAVVYLCGNNGVAETGCHYDKYLLHTGFKFIVFRHPCIGIYVHFTGNNVRKLARLRFLNLILEKIT